MALTNAERQAHWRARRDAELKQWRGSANGEKPPLASTANEQEAEIATLKVELARAVAEIAKLKAELARERQRHAAAEAKAQKPPLTEAERETKAESTIKRLQGTLREARAETRFVRQWRQTSGIPEKGGMSFATYGKIAKALHPDSTPSDADRAEGVRAFNAWVDELKTARRPRG